MRIPITIEVTHQSGRNLSAREVAEHIIDNLIAPGEDRQGRIWVDSSEYVISDARLAES